MPLLTSSLNVDHRHTQAQLNGIAYVSGGDWDKVQRWDGVGAAAELAGIVGAPSTWAPVPVIVAGNADEGPHLVQYRYLDEKTGYVSNASNAVLVNAAAGGSKFTFSISAAGPADIERSTDPKVTHIVLEGTTSFGAEFFEITRVANSGVTSVDYDINDVVLSESIFDYAVDGHDPPPYAQIVHPHRHIMFYAGSVVHATGTVTTSSSTTVTGVGTNWTEAVVDRRFQVDGDTRNYKIASFTSPTSLELEETYAGAGGSGQTYKIYKSDPNVIWHSRPLFPESVPPLFFTRVLQDKNDTLRALASYGNDLIILGDATMERWSYTAIPSSDGQIWAVPGRRGTVFHRTVIFIEGVLYGLDRQGIWAYSGESPVPISQKIENLFLGTTIDWTAAEKFHATWLPITRSVRWWYVEDGATEPNRFIDFDVDTQKWGTGGYTQGITASDTVVSERRLRPIVGDENGFAWWADTSTTDGVKPDTRTSAKVASGATTTVIPTVETDLFIANQGLAGAPVYWVEGDESAIISSNTASSLTLLGSGYSTAPLPGHRLELGRIHARKKTKAISIRDLSETEEIRFLHIFWEPMTKDANGAEPRLYVRVFEDYSTTAKTDWVGKNDGAEGVVFVTGEADIEVDLTNPDGYARLPLDLTGIRVVEATFEIRDADMPWENIGWAVDGYVDEYENMD